MGITAQQKQILEVLAADRVATELAWAAGFFDGEGCVTQQFPGYISLIVAQAGTTEHLERFKSAVGYGSINGPHTRGPNDSRQPIYHWNVSGKKAHAVMRLLSPFLCSPKVEKYHRLTDGGM